GWSSERRGERASRSFSSTQPASASSARGASTRGCWRCKPRAWRWPSCAPETTWRWRCRGAQWRPLVARTFALAALAGSLIAWNWFRLEEGSTAGTGALVVLLAISPALVRGLRRRIPVAVVAFLLAAGGAFQVS